MENSSIFSIIVFGLAAAIVACGGSSTPAQEPSQVPPASESPVSSSTGDGAAARPVLTEQACEASGGAVQGDIGDGAIHRPEYRCPNGAKPSGSIAAPDGGPIAVEGAVCCPR